MCLTPVGFKSRCGTSVPKNAAALLFLLRSYIVCGALSINLVMMSIFQVCLHQWSSRLWLKFVHCFKWASRLGFRLWLCLLRQRWRVKSQALQRIWPLCLRDTSFRNVKYKMCATCVMHVTHNVYVYSRKPQWMRIVVKRSTSWE